MPKIAVIIERLYQKEICLYGIWGFFHVPTHYVNNIFILVFELLVCKVLQNTKLALLLWVTDNFCIFWVTIIFAVLPTPYPYYKIFRMESIKKMIWTLKHRFPITICRWISNTRIDNTLMNFHKRQGNGSNCQTNKFDWLNFTPYPPFESFLICFGHYLTKIGSILL